MIKKLIGNVFLNITESKELLAALEKHINQNKKSTLFFVNAHCFNIAQSDSHYRDYLNNTDFVLNDGIGMDIAAKLFGMSFKENLNGTDLTPKILKMAEEKKYKVFLFGGMPGVAEVAKAKILEQMPDLVILGAKNGYESLESVVEDINESNVDILIVGLGVPLQEKWISNNINRLNVKLAMGVGAYLDFSSQHIRRAPKLLRTLKLEWFYRLIIEPKRMFKRYVIGIPKFLFFIIKYKIAFGKNVRKFHV